MSATRTRRPHAARCALAAVGILLCLAGCNNPEMQARANARGTAAPTGRMEDWGFAARASMQPGYLYQQTGFGAGW
jgi:hypothetical protein